VWEIELTDEASEWITSLDQEDRDAITGAIDLLETRAKLGAPRSGLDQVLASPQHEGAAFIRRKPASAVLLRPATHCNCLLGGDKTNDWAGWYEQNIPIADGLYDDYLDEIRKEGLI